MSSALFVSLFHAHDMRIATLASSRSSPSKKSDGMPVISDMSGADLVLDGISVQSFARKITSEGARS
jgi:hypothetical protein